MIEFIIYDDKEEFLKKYEQIINQVMSCENDNYKIIKFNSYNKKFQELIQNRELSRIYILDIEVPNSISGIDVSRKIRKNDWDSSIILVTSYVEMGYEALKAQIMLLDFISKFNNCEQNLKRTLKLALKKINNKKVLIYECNGITYRVFVDDIQYIIRDSIDRKSIITTTYNEFPINETISDIIEKLDNRFFLSHRSCIINTSMIRSIDWKNSIITFKDGREIDYIARDKKKELKEYVKNI